MANTTRKRIIKIGLFLVGGVTLVIGIILFYFLYYGLGFQFRLSKTPELIAMSQAASFIDVTTGIETKRREEDFHYALGMPVYAEIVLEYSPTASNSKQDLFIEIIQDLEENNFKQVNVESTRAGTYQAVLPHKRFEVKAMVIDIPDENVVRIWFSTILPPRL